MGIFGIQLRFANTLLSQLSPQPDRELGKVKTTLFGTSMIARCHIYFSKPINLTTPRASPHKRCVLWVQMISQGRLTTQSVWRGFGAWRRLCAAEAGGKKEGFVPSAQIHREPKIALNQKASLQQD